MSKFGINNIVNPIAKALLNSRRRQQIVPSKKGKGSYNRAKEKKYVKEHRQNDG
jgi:stalled ribosome alternative rescue factor ArfA|tara:strand:- start:2678 stop:2839 length:162 start_codon:yes stop_codon:yes gene_type:complete